MESRRWNCYIKFWDWAGISTGRGAFFFSQRVAVTPILLKIIESWVLNQDEIDLEETPKILLGSKWTALWITWGGGFISVGYQGSANPIFLGNFKKKKTISSMYPESFFQYGIMGTGVLWSMQFCEESKRLFQSRVTSICEKSYVNVCRFSLRTPYDFWQWISQGLASDAK